MILLGSVALFAVMTFQGATSLQTVVAIVIFIALLQLGYIGVMLVRYVFWPQVSGARWSLLENPKLR